MTGSSRRRIRTTTFQTAVVVFLLGAWEGGARLGFVPDSIPAPAVIAEQIADRVHTTELWTAAWSTLLAVGTGLAIAFALAVPIGIIVGSNRTVWTLLRPLAEILRPLPSLALLPLLVLVVGVGEKLKIYIAAYSAFWPLLFQTLYGTLDVDTVMRDVARAYRLGAVRWFAKVMLPTVAPYVATGLRYASVVALGACVAAELVVGGVDGIGREIALAQNNSLYPEMWAYVVVGGIIGVLMNIALRGVERRLLRWHASERRGVVV